MPPPHPCNATPSPVALFNPLRWPAQDSTNSLCPSTDPSQLGQRMSVHCPSLLLHSCRSAYGTLMTLGSWGLGLCCLIFGRASKLVQSGFLSIFNYITTLSRISGPISLKQCQHQAAGGPREKPYTRLPRPPPPQCHISHHY